MFLDVSSSRGHRALGTLTTRDVHFFLSFPGTASFPSLVTNSKIPG